MTGVIHVGYVEDLRKIIGSRPIILVGSVTVIVNDGGEILLQERTYPTGFWGLPGGLMELGETTEETARREVFEETSLVVDQLQFINVYSGPEYFVRAQNGDEFFMVTVAYYTKHFSGEMKVDFSESVSVRFCHPDNLPGQLVKGHKVILDEFLSKHYKNI